MKVNDQEFKFLREWADKLAWNMLFDETELNGGIIINSGHIKKISSILLESMSSAKGWKHV